MAKRDLPGIGLKGNYAPGEDGWGDDQNLNLLKLSALVQGHALKRLPAVPTDPAPVQGDVYVLTAAPNAQNLAVYDGGAWAYMTPAEGWLLFDRDANKYITFDGAAWTELATGGGAGGGLDEAPMDGVAYVRKDGAWVEDTYGSGGGGGGGGANLTLVQKAFARTGTGGYTVALATAPTVGNFLVMMFHGRYLPSPAGWTKAVQRDYSTVGVSIWYKAVEAGETGSYTAPSTSDWGGAALYEVSTPAGVLTYSGDTSGGTTFGTGLFPTFGSPSMAFLVATTDSTNTQTYTGNATIVDNTYQGGQSGSNHSGQAIVAKYTAFSKVTGTYSGGSDRQAWAIASFAAPR
jgi:hypothetical protein